MKDRLAGDQSEYEEGRPRGTIEVCYRGEVIPCTVIRSSRRTMAITVSQDARVILRLPSHVSGQEGQRFAEEHAKWIHEHLVQARYRIEKREEFHFIDGALLELHGETRRLTILGAPDEKSRGDAAFAGVGASVPSMLRVWENGREILVSGAADETAAEYGVKAWYKKAARSYLTRKTQEWTQVMDVGYKSISIRDQSSRWGSCSSKGSLNYNWRLVLLPEELSDYVVVHELAHRRQMNHSDKFWEIVGGVLPDYMERRRKLKEYEVQINTKY